MNISQKQTTLSEIEAIQNLDITSFISKRIPENTSIQTYLIGKYAASEFISLLNKAISQLKSELENGFGLLLPNHENFNNDYGQFTLDKDLGNLRMAIINNTDQQDVWLERLIYYQIRQGFWDRSRIKAHNVDDEKIKSITDRVNLAAQIIESSAKQMNELKQSLHTNIENIDSYLGSKKKEFDELKALENQANINLSKIIEISSAASNKETEITGQLNNINDKIGTVTKNITEYQATFEALSSDLSSCKNELGQLLASARTNLDTSQESLDFVQNKKEEIVRLTGLAADGALGSKFDQRQIALASGLSFWKYGVPIITVLSVVWVIAVFTWIPTHTNNIWIDLLINVIKTSPAFILMGFVFNQYGKERNLQEEYAFKSAVAMTLTAYSSMLEKGDEDANKTRQEMLLKSIQQVYMLPRIHSDKQGSIYTMNGRHLKEAISTLTETLKNIKP